MIIINFLLLLYIFSLNIYADTKNIDPHVSDLKKALIKISITELEELFKKTVDEKNYLWKYEVSEKKHVFTLLHNKKVKHKIVFKKPDIYISILSKTNSEVTKVIIKNITNCVSTSSRDNSSSFCLGVVVNEKLNDNNRTYPHSISSSME